MKNIADVFKALSDETRLRIINLLYDKELCVCDIMETLKITQTKASRHLAYLKNAGLVKDRKQARWVYYTMISKERLGFLDCVIYDSVRTIEKFKSDIVNLNIWLERKEIACE